MSFENLKLPVIAAPMFLTSGPDLVVECCNAGIVGTFPALNQRTSEGFEEWIIKIKEKTNSPFGVNLIVHKTNPRLSADLDICIKHKVPLVITSLGAVQEVVEKVHRYGGLVFHDVTNSHHAKKAMDAGVDGLILVCAGAGGHAGTLNPFAFVHEVKKFFKKTIILAGSLTKGSDIAAAQIIGADFAYMGTRFIATKESMVPEEYKQMIVRSQSSDIIYTPAISTIPANFMRESIVKAGMDPERLKSPEKIDMTHITEPHKDNTHSKAWKDIWSAGQGVGAIDEILSVKDLVSHLIDEYNEATHRFN